MMLRTHVVNPRDPRGPQVGCVRDDVRGWIPIYVRRPTSMMDSPSSYIAPKARLNHSDSRKRLAGPNGSTNSGNSSSSNAQAVGGQPDANAVIYQVQKPGTPTASITANGNSQNAALNGSAGVANGQHANASNGNPGIGTTAGANSAGTLQNRRSSRKLEDSSDADDVELQYSDTDSDLHDASHTSSSSSSSSSSADSAGYSSSPSSQKGADSKKSGPMKMLEKLISCFGCAPKKKTKLQDRKRRKESFDDTNSLADQDAGSATERDEPTPGISDTELAPFEGQGARLCSDGQDGFYYLVPPGGLLPTQHPAEKGRKTLILDLDETLVHSSFKPVQNPDFIVPVKIDTHVHQAYVLKRPAVDAFLKRCGELFEVIVFTASLSSYANPVLDLLDKYGVVRARLFREACVFYRGGYVKDVSKMGRPLDSTVIIDNFAASYCLTPNNGIPILSWFDDPDDRELQHMLPILERMAVAPTIYSVLDSRSSSGYESQASFG
eukprot:ANDGO_03103.mRNA.1 Phosphatase PSR1